MYDKDLTEVLVNATRGRSGGGEEAARRVFAAVYDELRAIARREMKRERVEHTLQPTALVNEAYLRLMDDSRLEWKCRAHFFGIAARAMRQVLIDHARRRGRAKRGGGWERVRLDAPDLFITNRDVSALELNETIQRLADLHERSAQVVELRVFAGLTGAEISAVLGVSRKTVVSDWRFARMWLCSELAGGEPPPPESPAEG